MEGERQDCVLKGLRGRAGVWRKKRRNGERTRGRRKMGSVSSGRRRMRVSMREDSWMVEDTGMDVVIVP